MAPVPIDERPPSQRFRQWTSPAAPRLPFPCPADAKATAPVEPPKYNDGTFVGWGYCRHGQIQSTIVIEHGRIVSAEITQCGTRYSCDWIAKLPGQGRQPSERRGRLRLRSERNADAFYYSIEDALKKAK